MEESGWKEVVVKKNPGGEQVRLKFCFQKILGRGTFGSVSRIQTSDGEILALKSQDIDQNFISRELEVLKMMDHPNIVHLKYYYLETGDDVLKLHLIMNYIQETLHRILVQFRKRAKLIPPVFIKVIMHQFLRAIKYLHVRNIAHRDLKPSNVLVNVETGRVKLCDFGSAKKLNSNETHIAYICTRHYRAPELVMGCTSYTTKVDIWSAGLIVAEMFLLHPVFCGESNLDQLTEMIRMLGTPTRKEIRALHPAFPSGLPKKEPLSWTEILEHKVEPQALILISMMVRYNPTERLDAWEALSYSFFNEIRTNRCRLPSGSFATPLNDFTPEELTYIPRIKELFDRSEPINIAFQHTNPVAQAN
ncbi:glycogen synthase kinase-3 beta-like isoform X2 [Varroa destructor]|nr:glycogen synthase kinase-3 beta-like isoform X2 [Varroa destructor]XP_022647126.1 glycogen synthase kinase-3 beta-like isoform X2 [Varroa destructor]XP_022647127.1 glycogen synthase kinase-3 beta-like isoform X2 [Varroa destructor]XP_022647128.1 glycogen synthase kinase-3 beta-like isoform X2 [Varroa destructor]